MLWPRARGPTNKALEVVQFVWIRQEDSEYHNTYIC